MTKDVKTHENWERLPGRPEPYVLRSGEGERSILVDSLATVLVSGDETGGKFGIQVMTGVRSDVIPAHVHTDVHHTIWVLDGAVKVWADDQKGRRLATILETNDFLYVPAGTIHTYQIISAAARMAGINSGGFERFVHTMGVPTDTRELPVGPIPPVPEDYLAATTEFGIQMRPDWDYADIEREVSET